MEKKSKGRKQNNKQRKPEEAYRGERGRQKSDIKKSDEGKNKVENQKKRNQALYLKKKVQSHANTVALTKKIHTINTNQV